MGGWLPIDVTVRAPRYKDYDNPPSDNPNPPPTYTNPPAYSGGGGSGGGSTPPGGVPLKVPGSSQTDERTDYRLYKKPCEAYNYMFNKALTSDSEVGALITDKGIIMLPNNYATLNSDGTRGFQFGSYSSDAGGYYLQTTNGKAYISGVIHTHPNNPNDVGPLGQPIGLPSLKDLELARDYAPLAQYIITPYYMNYFAAKIGPDGKLVLGFAATVYNANTAVCATNTPQP